MNCPPAEILEATVPDENCHSCNDAVCDAVARTVTPVSKTETVETDTRLLPPVEFGKIAAGDP
jgi:hypothetical protein